MSAGARKKLVIRTMPRIIRIFFSKSVGGDEDPSEGTSGVEGVLVVRQRHCSGSYSVRVEDVGVWEFMDYTGWTWSHERRDDARRGQTTE